MPEIRAATLEDVDTVFDLLSTRDRLLFGSSDLSWDLVAADFALEGFDRSLAVDGSVVTGYGHLAPTQDVVVAATDPVVGAALLARAEEQARGRRFDRIAIETSAEDDALSALVRRAGFTREGGVVQMWRSLGPDSLEPLVGCALYWKEEKRRGWLKDLAVADTERGRGIARGLLRHGFRAYAERGVERVGLKVDSANPTGAIELYERVGFVGARRHDTWTKQP